MRRVLTVAAVSAAMLAGAAPAHAVDLGRTTTLDRPPGQPIPFDGVSGSLASASGRSISDDGRYVAFFSSSDALGPAASPQVAGIYRLDRDTGQVVLASVSSTGAAMGQLFALDFAISGNGRHIAFTAVDKGVPADTNDRGDVYVRDLQTGTTTLVSVNGSGQVDPAYQSERPSISADGSTIAWETRGQLSTADTDVDSDVYARRDGTTYHVSVDDDGDNSASDATDADVGGDGTSVAFVSSAGLGTTPAVTDTGVDDDVFVRTGIGSLTPGTQYASHDGGGTPSAIGGAQPSMSGELTPRVAFVTAANVGGDSDGDDDVYTQVPAGVAPPALVSAVDGTADGDHSNVPAAVSEPSISGNGQTVAFVSQDPALVPGMIGAGHVFRRNGTATAVMDRADGASGAVGDNPAARPSLARDGSAVAFDTRSSLDPDDAGRPLDVFVRDGTTTLWAARPPSGPVKLGAGNTFLYHASQSGSHVLMFTNAPGLGVGPFAGILRVDVATGQLVQVDLAPGGGQPNGFGEYASMSGDGQFVAFTTGASNLVAGDDDDQDLLLRDLAAGTTRVLVDAGADPVSNVAMSADGRRVAFQTAASLAAADGNGVDDVYVIDVATGAITLVSVNGAGQVAATGASLPAISDDGTRVTFYSDATNMPDGDALVDAYVRDLAAQTTTLVSRTASGGAPDAEAFAQAPATISGDGSRVAWATGATNLGDGDTEPDGDVHVREVKLGGALMWGSRGPAGGLNGMTLSPGQLSTDGRLLLFASSATDADPADTDSDTDWFAKDLHTGALSLAARTDSGGSPPAHVLSAAWSGDGACVAFTTVGPGIDPAGYPSSDFFHVFWHARTRACPVPPPAPPVVPAPAPGPVLPSVPPRDRTAPRITKLKVVSERRRRVTISFTVSEDATVTVRILRELRGTRRGKRCVKRRRRGRGCTRLVRVGTVTRRVKRGDVLVVLKGKVGRRRLAIGRHRLEVTARDAAANTSRKASKRFSVRR